MVKIILEKEDIMEIIKTRYQNAELVTGLDDNTSITISVPNFQPVQQPVPAQTQTHTVVQQTAQPTKEVILKDGSIDASASGLTLENREETVPGGAMGKSRGNLPIF